MSKGIDNFSRVRVELPDNDGNLRGKVMRADKVASGKLLGISDVVYCLTIADDVFDGPLCNPETGFPDVLIKPDLTTLKPVPWEPGMGAVLADVLTKDGEPYPLCQREAVRRSERILRELGFEAKVALEFEIFLFAADAELLARRDYGSLRPISRLPHAYSLQRWVDMSDFAADVFTSLGQYGVELEMMHTELGFGAVEVALAPCAPLEAADRAARFKIAFKELAARHGVIPTFMAKWKDDEAGSSGHIHQSLWRNGAPAFWTSQDSVTPVCEQYLEGLLQSVADFSALFAPNLNSYRRPNPELWAPTTATWGFDNRTVCCRVLAPNADACRIEHRRPGADVSVYLSIAACIGGGAHGLASAAQLRPEAPRNGALVDDTSLQLPMTLREATTRLSGSPLAREILGETLVDHFVVSREKEMQEADPHQASAYAWELERYFETV